MTKARLALLIGVLIISSYPTTVKLNVAPSSIAAFYRMAIAFVVLLPLVIYKKAFQIPSLKVFTFAALSGVFIGADVSLWNIAIKASPIGQATLLVNLAPIWVGIASYFFLKQKPLKMFWVGAFVSFMGMIIFVGIQSFTNLDFDKAFLYALLAGVFYAAYIIASKKALNVLDLLPFFAISLFSASIMLLIVNLALGASFTGFSSTSWLIMLYQGLVVQLLAWLFINFAIKNMRATRVSLSLLSQAFLSAIIAYIVINESITLNMIIGGSVVVFGIALTFYEIEKPATPPFPDDPKS